MEVVPPMLPALATVLARPFVAVLDLPTHGFPVVGIGPLGDTAFPGGIGRAPGLPGQDECFAGGSGVNSELVHELLDGGVAHAEVLGNIPHRPLGVLPSEPLGILIRKVFSVVTDNVQVPVVLPLVPRGQKAASALA